MQLYLKIHMDNQWKQNFKEIPFQNRETPARKQLPWCSEAIATDGLLQLSSRGNHRALTGLATVLWGTERRKALCAALGRLAAPGDTHAVARLPGLLRYADWSERKAAVRAAGELAERGCGAAVRGLTSRLALDALSPGDTDGKRAAARTRPRVARRGPAALRECCRRQPADGPHLREALPKLAGGPWEPAPIDDGGAEPSAGPEVSAVTICAICI